MRIWRSWLALAIAAACIAVVAGCGSSSKTTTTTTATSSGGSSTGGIKPDPAIVKQVPSAIKSKGTITVAADASYAPDEFIGSDGHTVEGMDADLMKALGDVMGLKVNVTNQTFDSIIPGLAAGKYDVGASSFTDTKEREKTVDFADYFVAGESFFTKAQGGTTVTGLDDSLCGKTVAVEKGTTEQDDATKQGAKCKAAGKPGVTVLAFPDQNGANLALSSGRAQLGFADSPVAAYQVKKSNGQFKLVGASIENAPYGLAVPKNSGLLKPLLAALVSLKKNGQYESILSRWGIQAGAIKQFKENGATS
ncbi:MAG TPA: ABC transporter substrate-binding protein [Solirubrobacteraceae bacterium]|jgi:polar amino acid transport system substrate-binding protein